MQLDLGAWKTSCEREVDRRERGSFPDDGMAFQSRRTIFFFCPGNPDEKSRAQRWSMRSLIHGGENGGEKGESVCVYIYMYIYSVYIFVYILYFCIYILDALSARNAATDLHQGNHDDTSYGKSLEWDTDIQGFGRYIYVHTGSIGRAFLYSIALHRDGTHGFLMGCKNQDWLN